MVSSHWNYLHSSPIFLGGSKGAPYLFSGEVVIPKGL